MGPLGFPEITVLVVVALVALHVFYSAHPRTLLAKVRSRIQSLVTPLGVVDVDPTV